MEVIWRARLEGKDADDYDAFVLASPAGHTSQTRAWAEVARAAGHAMPRFVIAREEGRVVGAAMALRTSVAGVALPWAWIERGPVVSDVADVARVTEAIARAALRRGIARLRVMPYWADEDAGRVEEALRTIGFRDVHTTDAAHGATLRIDIGGKSDAELFSGKSKEQVRWRAKQAEKAGARARRGVHEDWPRLREMHATLMRSQGRRDKPDEWWEALERFVGDEARGAFFACEYESRVVAVTVVLRHGTLANYSQGASVGEKLPFSKAIPPLLAAIRWARDVGCSTFDLGGIPFEGDDDPKRKAIATFKFDFDKKRVRLVHEHAGWCVGRR